MRQIVLDTETTGLSTAQGHRIIEIGCVELVNRRLTGREFHRFLNPDRDIDEGAERVHGISRADLETAPRFAEIVDDFLAFIKDAQLIIHNASFDVGFLEHELTLMKHTAAEDRGPCHGARHADPGPRIAPGAAQQPGRVVQTLRSRCNQARRAWRTHRFANCWRTCILR